MAAVCKNRGDSVGSKEVSSHPRLAPPASGSMCGTARDRAATHSIDSRQLLGQLEHDGNHDGLLVAARPEELQHRGLLLLCHPRALIFHLLDVLTHVLGAPQSLEDWSDRQTDKDKVPSRLHFPCNSAGKKSHWKEPQIMAHLLASVP